jgi:putative ABC transport system permease protein
MLKAMLGEAWQAMGANRMRTALTMLGMVIGVGSVVLMMAIGQGAQYAVAQTISTMGSNLYIVISGSTSSGGVRSGAAGPTLNVADAEAIAELDGVSHVAPVHQGTQQLVYGANNWSATVVGTTPAYLDARAWTVTSGYLFGDSDVRSATRVALIGKTTAANLFGDETTPSARPSAFAEPLHRHRRSRAQGPEPRRARPGRHGHHSADHRPAQGLRHALAGSVRMIMVQAASAEAMPASKNHDRPAPPAPPPARRTGQRLLHAQPRRRRRLGRRNDARDVAAARRHRLGIAARRRHRHHEHHARLGHRANARNRHPHGHRRPPEGHPRSQFLLEAIMISIAGCLIGLLLGIGGALLVNALTDMVIVISGGSVLVAFRRCRRDRRLLRLLPGAQGRRARPDRSAAPSIVLATPYRLQSAVRNDRETPAMPIYALGARRPQLDPQSWVAPTAIVIGDVRLAKNASIWWNATCAATTTRSASARTATFRTTRCCTPTKVCRSSSAATSPSATWSCCTAAGSATAR